MDSVIVLILVVAGIVVAVWLLSKAHAPATVDTQPIEYWPFYLKRPLTRPEQVLYFRLTNALPEHIVLAQMQLSRFLGVEKGYDFRAWYNRINRMSADFLVCGKDATVLVAIELDDKTHEAEYRQLTDAKKEKALSAAGVKLIRWRTTDLPDDTTIRREVLGQ